MQTYVNCTGEFGCGCPARRAKEAAKKKRKAVNTANWKARQQEREARS